MGGGTSKIKNAFDTFGDDVKNVATNVGDNIANTATGLGDDIAQAFDNCKNMDGRNPPNKIDPTSNKDLLNYIKPCTMYEIDEETLQPEITKLLFPNDRKNQNFGDAFTIPDYCSPNVAIFGTDFSSGYQTSFINDYCKNITPVSIKNESPQDVIVKAYLPQAQPEWLNTKEAQYIINTISKAGIESQIFSLANTGKINYQITSSANANDISREKPIDVSQAPNADIAQAQKQSIIDADNQITQGALDTTIGSGIVSSVVIASGTFASESAIAASLGPAALAAGAIIVASGFIKDIIDEDDCYYNDMKVPSKVGGYGCCRGACAIRGKEGSCQRNIFGYKADVFQCCIQDFYCKTNNGKNLSDTGNNALSTSDNLANTDDGTTVGDVMPLCYQQKDNRTYACDPHYRGMNQSFCKDILLEYCTGQVPYLPNQSSLLQAWVPGSDPINVNGYEVSAPCLNFLARLLAGPTNSEICTWDDFVQKTPEIVKSNIRGADFVTAQKLLDQVLTTYLKVHGNPVQSINSDGYYENSAFIEWYFNFCTKYPILCQESLRDNFCVDYSLNNLADNPSLANWCGCYLPKEEYNQYTQYNVDISCTPTCNRANTIPLADDITGKKDICTQNVCIMDDIAVRLIKTESSGNISFTQACHSCGQNRVSNIVDSKGIQATVKNSKDSYTLYLIVPPSDIQATVIIPQNIEYPGGTTSQLLQPQIGRRLVSKGQLYAPAQGPVQIIRLDTNVSGLATFSYMRIPSSGGYIYWIIDFEEIPDIFYDPANNNKTNIASGTLILISQLLVTGDKYYTYFQVIGKKQGGISIQSTQTIGNFVSQYNLGRDVNECRCIFHDTTIDLVESQLKGANFSQNCGQTETNKDGKTVPNKIELNNQFSIQNSIKSSITSTEGFIEEINVDKNQFTITVLGVISFLLVVMQYLLTRYPRKYGRIICVFILFIICAIAVIYLYYSFEVDWGAGQGIESILTAGL